MLCKTIVSIVQLPFDVFRDAYIDTVVFITANMPSDPDWNVTAYAYQKHEKVVQMKLEKLPVFFLKQSHLGQTVNAKFILNGDMLRVIVSLGERCSKRLEDIAEMKRGVLFDKGLIRQQKESVNSYPYFDGNIYRYVTEFSTAGWVEYR